MKIQTDRRIIAIFSRFQAIYGHKWQSQLPPGDEGMLRLALKEWGDSLRGLNQDQIDMAVEQARYQCEWPPSIAEFLRLALGIPSVDDVLTWNGPFRELGPIGKLIEQRISHYDFCRMTHSQGRKYLRTAYNAAVRQFMDETGAYLRKGIKPPKSLTGNVRTLR